VKDLPGVSLRAGGWFEAALEWALSHAMAETGGVLEHSALRPNERRRALADLIASSIRGRVE